MKNYLIGVDPGLATGLCVIDISDMDNPTPLESFELTNSEFYDKMDELIERYGNNLEIVVENYIVTEATAKKTPQPYSLQLKGVCLYLGHKHGINVTVQDPSRKSFATNDKLRKVGFWVKNSNGHDNDAYRHAMVWIVDHYPKWTKNLLL